MIKATDAQVEHLTDLFIDCGFPREERKAFLAKRFHRSIPFLDELSKSEASQAISELRDQKERKHATKENTR